ncbi:MAG: hypothetical protein HC884_09160 [Chloroflexaceae bacterium]|nr:hypothetical protein [Chloroflexaceae bacterium]
MGGNQLGVPTTKLTLAGTQSLNTSSGQDGAYAFSNIPKGNYTLTPAKTDKNHINGISSYDAALVLKHVVKLETLQGPAAIAADVDQSGTISSLDAAYILQKSVGLIDVPFPNASAIWVFAPSTYSYNPLGSDQTGQDFTAILLGDPSGNWSPSGGVTLGDPVSTTVMLSLPEMETASGERVRVPVSFQVPGDIELPTSFDLIVTYDPSVVSVVEVQNGDAIPDWSLAFHADETLGHLKIGVSGDHPPVSRSGELVVVTFDTLGDSGEATALTMTMGSVEETELAEPSLQSGQLRVGEESSQPNRIFLPLVHR